MPSKLFLAEQPMNPFASFDPRIDGYDAPVGYTWHASDCPITMTKVGPATTDWLLDTRSSFALCTTEAQINALYQGLARQPLLDFTPSHLLTPDVANNRFTDTAGDHLTKQGAGAGATIEKGPLFDERAAAGFQAQQIHANASYYAAVGVGDYDVAAGAYCVAWLGSYTQTPEGGVVISDINMPAGIATGTGWAVTINEFGGFGFLINGPALDLNADTAFGAPSVADGRVRIFHHGRSVLAAGLGYVRTPGIPPVTQVGLPGNISNVDALFGLIQDAGGARTAAGNQQVQRIAFWEGAAAENVLTYLDAIEDGLQAQIGSTTQQLVKPPAWQDFVVQVPARALNVAFQPNPIRPTWCNYSVNIEVAGLGSGTVELLSDAANPPVTVISTIKREIQAGAFVDNLTAPLTHWCAPGHFVLIRTTVNSGAGVAFNLVSQSEFTSP